MSCGIQALVIGQAGTSRVFAKADDGKSASAKRLKLLEDVLERIPPTRTRKSFGTPEGIDLHYTVEDRIVYICVQEHRDGALRIPYQLLDDVKQRFCQQYGAGGPQEPPDADRLSPTLCKAFNKVAQDRLKHHNDPNSDKFTAVRNQTEEVKMIMIENIEKVIERGDKIDTLVDQTDELTVQTREFKKKATELKRASCMKKYRYQCLCLFILVIILGIIAFLVCEFAVHCKKKSDSSPTTSPPTNTPPPAPLPPPPAPKPSPKNTPAPTHKPPAHPLAPKSNTVLEQDQ